MDVPRPATWPACGAGSTTVELTLRPDGHFTWTATIGGKTRSFSGQHTAGGEVLTLVSDNGPAIAGRIASRIRDLMTRTKALAPDSALPCPPAHAPTFYPVRRQSPESRQQPPALPAGQGRLRPEAGRPAGLRPVTTLMFAHVKP
jgi:hypothetical protein